MSSTSFIAAIYSNFIPETFDLQQLYIPVVKCHAN